MRMILFRYLVREQGVPLAVSLMGVTLIMVTGRLLQLTRYLFSSPVTLLDLVEVMAFAMPKLLLYALPMASMTGVLLAFVRLNSDNELVAFRAAGISFCRFLPPVLFVAFLTTISSLCTALFIMPPASQAFDTKLRVLGQASLPALLKENTIIDIIPKMVFFFDSVNTSDLSIRGVFLQDQRQPDVRMAIVAQRARILYQQSINLLTFKIQDGVITRIPEKNLKDAQVVSFREYDVAVPLDELLGGSSESSKSKGGMTLAELRQMIRNHHKAASARYVLEFHQRFALPVGCLLLALIGAPLGAIFRQRNRMAGVTLGLTAYFLYYIILSAGKGLGKKAFISPSVAVWTPNVVALAVAVYLWVKMQRETQFELEAVWIRLTSLLRNRLNALRSKKGRNE